MKYRIAWRKGHFDRWLNVVQFQRGLSRYVSPQEAEQQVKIFKRFFPLNTYVVEPVS